MIVEIPMTPLMIAALGVLMVATAFLSGLFGMAGGMILIGVLLMLMPLPTAMVLHAITQMASNGWRAFLWRAHIRWRPVFVYLIGCALALGVSLRDLLPEEEAAALPSASPRARGEADARSAAGEGDSPRTTLAEAAPHPDLLKASFARLGPAGGEKGKRSAPRFNRARLTQGIFW